MLKSIQTPDMKSRLAGMGGEPIPARAAGILGERRRRYARLVREGKVKPIQ